MRLSSQWYRAVTLAAALAFAVGSAGIIDAHPADHDGDAAHVEIPHGGHDTVLVEIDDRIPSQVPTGFAALETVAAESGSTPGVKLREPVTRDFEQPRCRPPPTPLGARAPPPA